MAVGTWFVWSKLSDTGPTFKGQLIVHTVKRENLQLVVTERGTLEAAQNRDVTCQVKASKGSTIATTIRWVIDDGTHVEQGDELVRLDDSGLQEQLKTQMIVRDKARNEWRQAEATQKITASQSESDLATAKVTKELADLDLNKFKEGDMHQQTADVGGRILMAESDLEQWQDRDVWLDRMVSKGFLTPKQAQSDRYRLQGAELALKKVHEEENVLSKYTFVRTSKELQSKIDEAKRSLERLKTQSVLKEEQTQSDTETKKSVYVQEKARAEEIEDEIRKCVITAPQDGLVVYYVPDQMRFGGGQQSIIAQGEPVREGQKIMRIPNLSQMLVNVRVHEAMRAKVRGDSLLHPTDIRQLLQIGLIRPMAKMINDIGAVALRDKLNTMDQIQIKRGLPAEITIDAFASRAALRGHVKTVDEVPAQMDWTSMDVTVYRTMVSIDGEAEGLKPGMKAAVKIYTETKAENVLIIPTQSVIGNPTSGFFVYVKEGEKKPIKKQIQLGMNNEKMVEVKEGLSEGDEVILNIRDLEVKSDKGPESSQGKGKEKKNGGRPEGAPKNGSGEGKYGG